ncbi:MAG: UvrD-helicase domain-containing protein [Gammaproteobacteria bacterium]|nr:UvrD-helicase domain-containing protein [Gammaproteobacteria bacterium]
MSQGDLFAVSAAPLQVKFISAGAGSGKTYRLTQELERALTADGIDPARVVGTTFTVKAAAELNDRVRARLIASGQGRLAERLSEGLIGTVHSVCERLLKRFAFELGLSPALNVVSLEDAERFFAQALDQSLDTTRVRQMNGVARRLEIDDWQGAVKRLVDAARSNDVSTQALRGMARPMPMRSACTL